MERPDLRNDRSYGTTGQSYGTTGHIRNDLYIWNDRNDRKAKMIGMISKTSNCKSLGSQWIACEATGDVINIALSDKEEAM